MKISYNWLKEFLPDLTQSPAEVAQLLTMHSFETTVIQEQRSDEHIRVVRIEKIEPHPNADRLRLATVTDGQETIRVVCGAPNINEGDVVPYAMPGAQVVDDEGKFMKVSEATIRGEQSPGMLASPRELGLGNWHTGIFILPKETPLGSLLSEHLPPDTVLEADITPNRAHDCLSHRGIARELAVLTETQLQEPQQAQVPPAQTDIEEWTIAIEDPSDTPRYSGTLLKNITVKSSPLWMQARLFAMGARPINNVVDSTNYVMFELGNPVHAFDAHKLSGKTMGIRRAKEKEHVTTLDGTKHALKGNELVITNVDTPVALAGVMGGASSEVDETTTEILLEAANFAAYTIQQTAVQGSVSTEASRRFSKGLDPNLVGEAVARISALLQEYAGAQVVGTVEDYQKRTEPYTITYNPESLAKVAGTKIDVEQARNILERLRCDVQGDSNEWTVTPPTDRLDLMIANDLTEEVLRIKGLEDIPSQLPKIPEQPRPLPAEIQWRETMRDVLVVCGMTETYNHAFEDSTYAQELGITAQPLELVNPTAPERRYLRRSLIPGLIKTAVKNRGKVRVQQLFEIGNVFTKVDSKKTRVPGVSEVTVLGGIIVGYPNAKKIAEDYIQTLLEKCGMPDGYVTTQGAVMSPLVSLGSVQELTPEIRRAVKVTQPAAVFGIQLDLLIQHATGEPHYYETGVGETVQYEPISKYPPVFRDVSMIVDDATRIEMIQEIIERVGGTLVVDVELFDIFRQENEGKKSVAFHVHYQASDRTLTDEEINKVHESITTTLQQDLNAHVR